MQFLKRYSGPIIVLAVLFVAIGDKILPEPMKSASRSTRATVNEFVINLVPNRKPKTNPYERTEKEIEKLEK
jgi:hypothetical protein